MGQQVCLHSGAATGFGDPAPVRGSDVLFRASLGAAGGTATCNVYTRVLVAEPWRLRCTFTLSGANDSAELAVSGESWAEARGEIAAISGAGAFALIGMGT